MTRITDQQLKAGLDISRKCSMCPDSVSCFWFWVKRKDFPKRSCRIESCSIPGFGKIFGGSSPVLYGKLFEFSDCQRRLHNFYGLQIEGGIEGGAREQIHESQVGFHDLHIFTQAVLLVLYSLYLANREEIPLLMPEEVNEEPLKLPENQIDPIGKVIYEINREWTDWIMGLLSNLYWPEKYTDAIFWLVRVFLKGVKKTELPCLSEVSACKKEQFFRELEEELYAQK